MWVIKLGGSLLQTPELPLWLETLSDSNRIKRCIVPGGGLFADSVRAQQQQLGFSDRTAHQLALLAMTQFAEYCQGQNNGFALAQNPTDLTGIIDSGKTPIMAPHLWPGIEILTPSWSLTSDSIAAWFAAQIDAQGLILIKSIDSVPASHTLDELVKAEIVDPLFPQLAGKLSCPVKILPRHDFSGLNFLLQNSDI